MGDFANVEIRSRDVFSLHHFPLLGTSTSASKVLDVGINHPGPILFYICAPFVELLGGPIGLATAVATINASAVAGSIFVAHRIFGRSGALSSALVSSILTWTLGSGLLVAAWNPYVLLLPCLLMLFLTAGVASGRGMMLPWLLFVGTFCVQTHLGYIYIVVGLCAFAVVMLGITDFKRRTKSGANRQLRRGWLLGLLVMLLGWLPPLWEQFFVGGNLGNLVEGIGKDVHKLGMNIGVRLVAAVVALPPFWNRSSLSDSIPALVVDHNGRVVDDSGIPGLRSSLFALGILILILVYLVIRARRMHDRGIVAACMVSAFAICLAIFASANTLPNFFGAVASYNLFWLWPIGAFSGFVFLISFLRSAIAQRHAQSFSMCLVGCLVSFSALTIPTHHDKVHMGNAETFKIQAPLLAQVLQQLDSFRPHGTVVVDTSNEPLNCPYYTAIMAYLQRRGIDFNVPDTESGVLRQMGPARAIDGKETATIHIYVGRSALNRRGDDATIAFVSPLSTAEETELHHLESELARSVRRDQIALTENARQLAEDGKLFFNLTEFKDALMHPLGFIADGFGITLFRLNYLELNSDDLELFKQLNTLRSKIENVAITVQVEQR